MSMETNILIYKGS